jgi:hypothetical protein
MITAIVPCVCKKSFAVRIPEQNATIELPENTFHVGLCPHCKMLTRFKIDTTSTMEMGEYAGKMEINEKMPSLSKN